jgi:hypothetical protein
MVFEHQVYGSYTWWSNGFRPCSVSPPGVQCKVLAFVQYAVLGGFTQDTNPL